MNSRGKNTALPTKGTATANKPFHRIAARLRMLLNVNVLGWAANSDRAR
jgi:hypothetical protein